MSFRASPPSDRVDAKTEIHHSRHHAGHRFAPSSAAMVRLAPHTAVLVFRREDLSPPFARQRVSASGTRVALDVADADPALAPARRLPIDG